jgi:four helix bundle protein
MSDSEESKPFQTFEDMDVYKVAREFRKSMYAVTRRLPEFEKYDLGRQIRRASVSLTNNIAEGHGRYHYLDQIKFQLQARGSLEELIDDLNICVDEAYLTAAEVQPVKGLGWRVGRLINGYIRHLREKKAGSSLQLRDAPSTYDEMTVLLDEILADPRFNDPAAQ